MFYIIWPVSHSKLVPRILGENHVADWHFVDGPKRDLTATSSMATALKTKRCVGKMSFGQMDFDQNKWHQQDLELLNHLTEHLKRWSGKDLVTCNFCY